MAIRPLTQNLLRANRRQKLLEEKSGHEAQLRNPYAQDKGAAIQSIKNIDKMLLEQSPLPISEVTAAEKDKLWNMEKALAEEIREGLPCTEDQRRCPAGNIGRHMRAEKGLKKKILTWKNIRIQLNPDDTDPDLANIEMLRKEKGTDGTTGFVSDAMGPRGHLSYGNIPEQQWPLGPATADTALAQTKRVHSATTKKKRPPMTEEQKQVLKDRLQQARQTKANNAKARTQGTESAAHAI